MKKLLCCVFMFVWIIPQLDYRIYLDMFPSARETARCESGINAKALNPKDTDGLPAKGLFQFKDKTFYSWAKLARISEPNIWDPMQQIILYRWAEENGLLGHFGCHKILINKGLAFLFNL